MRVLVIGAALVALAGCETQGETAMRSSCAAGDTAACSAVAAVEDRRRTALATGLQGMSQSFQQNATRYQPVTTNCRYTPGTWVGSPPSGYRCTSY